MAEVFDEDRLAVGRGHVLAYEQRGAPSGLPVVFLHGGPGSGTSDTMRRLVDPARHRGVLFDQRSAGRSTPHASEPGIDWSSIDLDHHVGDIERLRAHLGIERWAVFGASWGSVLALAYAERHPERVTAVVAAAVSTGTRAEIDWLTVHVGRIFPEAWERFVAHVPASSRSRRLVDAYAELLRDPDPAVHGPAAAAWCAWEDAHVATAAGATPDPRYDDPRFRLAFARQVTHCWRHDCWLAADELVRHAPRLAGIPTWLVHGRLDVSSPLEGPWRLHRALPGSHLLVIDDEGHGGTSMWATCRRLLADLA